MSSLGYNSPPHWNPADYLLELITENFASDELNIQKKKDIKMHLIKVCNESFFCSCKIGDSKTKTYV